VASAFLDFGATRLLASSSSSQEELMKRLSEQLADISVRAKSAEEAVEAAQKEAHEKIVVRREQAAGVFDVFASGRPVQIAGELP